MIHTEIIVTIDSLSSDGDGVGRTKIIDAAQRGARSGSGGPASARWTRRAPAADSKLKRSASTGAGRVVFVPGTAPGDTVRARIIRDKKRFLVATPLEILTPGPARVEPLCKHAGQCGGCHWQQVGYEAQLLAKEQLLTETLLRVGALEKVIVRPIKPSPSPYAYRNRIQGEVVDGHYFQHARGTGDPVRIDRCEIADAAINVRLQAGFAKHPAGRVEIALEPDNEIRVVPIADDRTTELGFRQVNSAIEEQLIALLAEEVASTPSTQVIDLYCGRGAWTCSIAERCPERSLIGIDVAEDNIRAANATKREQKLNNVEFRLGRVERQLMRLPLTNAACIVDPPRAGLDKSVIQALIAHPVQELWYVSCHPATLARDLALLVSGGYRVKDVQPFDMFPQTPHLECLARLSTSASPAAV